MQDPVVTPEAVALELEPATVGSRSVAIILDYLLMLAGLLLIGAAEAAFGFGGFVPGWLGLALLLLLAFALQFGYPIGFETLARGRTPGKAAMGLRVITTEGAPVGFRHAAVRAAVGLLELMGTLGAVAVVASFVSPRGQRLGDLAAGTLVVRERRAGGAPQAVHFEPPRGLESYVRILDVSRLDATDYGTIRDLLRRPLDAATRESVARQVADGLRSRVQPDPPAGVDAVTWLVAVAAAVQSRGGAAGAATEVSGRAPSHGDPRATPEGQGTAGTGPARPGRDPSGAPTGEEPGTRGHQSPQQQEPEPGPPPPPSGPGGFRPPE